VVSLLQEIAELRLSAATNLTLAAAAMDAARPDIATELIEAQQRDVAHLRDRAALLLGLDGPLGEQTRRAVLHDAAVEEFGLLQRARVPATKSLRKQPSSGVLVLPPRREQSLSSSRWSASGALLAIAATIAVALVRPLAPPAPATPDPASSVSVMASLNAKVQRSYGELQETASPRTPTFDVEQSAQRLHANLTALLPEAAKDPDAANRLLGVLRAERALLSAQAPGALDAFQVEAVRILTQLGRIADPEVLAVLPDDVVDVVGPLPSQVGDAVASFSRVAPPAADKGTTTGSVARSDGTTAGSGADESASSAPAPGPADAPDPPVKAPTPVLTDTDSGSSGSSGGGTTPVVPDPLPSVNPVPLLPQLPQLPSTVGVELPQH
jgi:hypothetical protein